MLCVNQKGLNISLVEWYMGWADRSNPNLAHVGSHSGLVFKLGNTWPIRFEVAYSPSRATNKKFLRACLCNAVVVSLQ